MIVAALAQLRFAASILFALPFANWSLDRLIDAALATRREFGAIGVQAGALLTGPSLDPSVCREMQTRRLRSVARTAIHETAYYRHLFASLGVVPDGLQLGNLGALPLTPKVALRNTPDAFVRKSQRPILRALTTGTTGVPASVHFAADELHAIVSLSALGFLMQRQISPEDVVQISTSTTSVLGNLGLAGACARIGAVFSVPGTIQPERSLQMLSAVNRLQGKKPRTSVLSAHPSYLGQLVDTAEHLRYGPSAFGLERILTGGEIVTEGLKGRARRVFGDVVFHESYAMTETIPFGGTPCAQGLPTMPWRRRCYR